MKNKRSILLLIGVAMTLLFTFGQTSYRAVAEVSIKQIQLALQKLGYPFGVISEIWDNDTKIALQRFEQDYHLPQRGVPTHESLHAMGLVQDCQNDSDVVLLAHFLSQQANDDFFLQVAIGAVIVNRKNNENYPNSIYSVLQQKSTFPTLAFGDMHAAPLTKKSLRAAKSAMEGVDPTHGAILFYHVKTVTQTWVFQHKTVYVRNGFAFSTMGD